MTALWFSRINYSMSEAVEFIGQVYGTIESEFARRGFSDIGRNELYVGGVKSGVNVAVTYLHIQDRRFWQVIMCAGDAADTTVATHDEVAKFIREFQWL
jgi:hypothetical protein